MKTTHILLKVEHTQEIPDLTDIAAGRVYTVDKVHDASALILDEKQVSRLELQPGDLK